MTQKVTDNDFVDVVENAEGIVLVDFWAKWCGPCKILAPLLEGRKTPIYKLEVDENPQTAMEFGVRSIPMMVAMENGSVIETAYGIDNCQKLVEKYK